jgi:uridine phosphorylase
MKKEFPILEFDYDRDVIIDPQKYIKKLDIPKTCVITFFRGVIQEMFLRSRLIEVANIYSETVDIPVYKTVYGEEEICLVQGFLGSAGAAAQLEELIAMGCENFIVCGGAGVLVKGTKVGDIIVPKSAVRDEGASYHYLPPSREVEMNKDAFDHINSELTKRGIPFAAGKTWTTDAFYRETRKKVELRVSEGCIAVDMEAAAYFAVAEYRGVKLGQILYSGDDLSGAEWDGRKWKREEVRRNIVEISMDIVLKME